MSYNLNAAEVLESFLREEEIEETASYATASEFAADAVRRLDAAGFRLIKNASDMPNFETAITAAAKRLIRIIDTGYLPDNFKRDIELLMQGALAYEVVAGKADARQQLDSQE